MRVGHTSQGGMVTRRLTAAAIFGCAFVAFWSPGSAVASPVATSDAQYLALGRVFPDPLAGCQLLAMPPCSPNAQGNVPAAQFIQYTEFVDALKYMNQRPEWRRFLEVWPLDGKLGDGSGTGLGADAFPGNNLARLEFSPKAEYRSAGIPTTTLDRKQSDLIVVRVTDETVPDKGKKRYALSLSIHGIERAGLEGGTRAMEDLVTAYTTGRAGSPVVSASVKSGAPTFGDVLKKTIIYFTYPNPDGWRRGAVSEGGVFFQRYNGNGVDVNRDWPDIGFSFRPYSGLSEPESRGLSKFLLDVRSTTRSPFTAGDDLHGQPGADALSYTLLPHGAHDYAKDLRIRETAKAIHRATYEAVKWSPIVQGNDAPQGGGVPCSPAPIVSYCAKIYGQTWGTVYDTINYTTTGALGDWFDSSVGLGADGIDNEMSFSHLDKNIVFDPHTEQLHVDGNKSLIYAHLAEMLAPASGKFDVPGAKGYVPNRRLVRREQVFQADPNRHTVAQDDIHDRRGVADPADGGQTAFPFVVERTAPAKGRPGIDNGGMRVDITTTNADGIGTGMVTLQVQCKGCDEHPGVHEDDEWVTVAEDYNQSFVYAQVGVTAAVNRPQAHKSDGTPIEWRAVVGQGSAITRMDIDFTSGPASTDGATGGDDPPVLKGYDVANTDFFRDLNKHVAASSQAFSAVDPRAVISGAQSLAGLKSLVLADDPLPGYTGPFGGVAGPPAGPPTAGFEFASTGSAPGAGSRAPGTYETKAFTIGPDDGNAEMKVRVDWASSLNDFDLFLYRKDASGNEVEVGNSAAGSTTSEELAVADPKPGDYVIYVDNFAAADPSWTGSLTFTGRDATADTGTGAYTAAEKDAWFDALRAYVEGGGNLVLTDGALRALPELTSIPAAAVGPQTVYAGQLAFATSPSQTTLSDPLARDIAQDGARFNSGMRRQTYEPTPLGFAIQDSNGGDASFARQYDVDRDAFTQAGGRVAATSADSGARDALPVYSRVALGEIPLGAGSVRIAGALLPQPTEAFDHTLGLEPYAVTYTGYILWRNLLG